MKQLKVEKLRCKIKPVDAIPKGTVHPKQGTSVYDRFLDEFLAANVSIALLDIDWPEETTWGQVESVIGSLKNRIIKRELELRVVRRQWEIYLAVKADPVDLAVKYAEVAPIIDGTDERLAIRLECTDLPFRAFNCLQHGSIYTLGELIQLRERDLLRFRALGRVSVEDIKRMLRDYGLRLGMKVGELPPMEQAG